MQMPAITLELLAVAGGASLLTAGVSFALYRLIPRSSSVPLPNPLKDDKKDDKDEKDDKKKQDDKKKKKKKKGDKEDDGLRWDKKSEYYNAVTGQWDEAQEDDEDDDDAKRLLFTITSRFFPKSTEFDGQEVRLHLLPVPTCLPLRFPLLTVLRL
jgi:hypothetical protein